MFVAFFSIGAAVLSGSILCADLLRYYQNRQLLNIAKESLERLESLNADYDVLLVHLEKDPNLIKRIGPVTLGTKPEGKDTIYPKVTVEQLAAARKVLTTQMNQQPAEPIIPNWITRCNEPHRRTILFFAGTVLILISFICFGPVKEE